MSEYYEQVPVAEIITPNNNNNLCVINRVYRKNGWETLKLPIVAWKHIAENSPVPICLFPVDSSEDNYAIYDHKQSIWWCQDYREWGVGISSFVEMIESKIKEYNRWAGEILNVNQD